MTLLSRRKSWSLSSQERKNKESCSSLEDSLSSERKGVWTNSPIHGEMDRRGRKRERIISFGVSKASSLVS